MFGYYIEVTKAPVEVPAGYMRKQTLVNAERFMTPELKALEERVNGSGSEVTAREEDSSRSSVTDRKECPVQ